MTTTPHRARFGPYEVDLHTHELWKFGTRLKLVGQPFEILAVLLRAAGELVTRDELRQRLWPSDTFVDFNHGLNAAVNKLREALSDSADNPRYVETLPRRGYRFIAKIEWLPTETPAPAPVQVPLSAANKETRDAPLLAAVARSGISESRISNPPPLAFSPDVPNHTRTWTRLLIGAGALFLLFLAIAFLSHSPAAKSSAIPVEHTRPLLSIVDTSSPAFSPDGNSVAFFRDGKDPGIYVTPVGGDHPIRLTTSRRDCCPAWSPDGRWIAFSRYEDKKGASVYLVPADAGAAQKRDAEQSLAQPAAFISTASSERKLDTGGITSHHGEIDWSPDGKSIVFSGPSGLYSVFIDNSSIRRLTIPPPLSQDWGPQFSPDGRAILFVRSPQLGQHNELWTIPASGGEGSRLLTEPGMLASAPQWSYDGRSIIYSSNRNGHPFLYRVSLDAPDSAVEISAAGSPAWDPAVSRRGYRLAYERLLRSLSIWQLDLTDSSNKKPYLLVSSTSDTDQGPGPQFSPDGQHLAFMSDRSGTMEIWIANRDGTNPFQLSAVGGAGTPRWSPSSDAIVFDAQSPDGEKIVTMNLHGGAPQVLAKGIVPSYSRDGKWIYFASTHSGEFQVWKVPVSGGTPIQVTQHGGHAALESLDGKYLYYAKSQQPEPEIWRMPLNAGEDGGEEVPMPLIHPGTWASFQVVEGGILFVGPALGHQAVLNFYDAAKDRTSSVAVLNRIPFWLGASPNGHTVAFDQPGQEESQAMLLENFH